MDRTELHEHITKERLRAWIYSGVELELELTRLKNEIVFLEHEQTKEEYEGEFPHPDIKWNHKRIRAIDSELALVNERINEIKSRIPIR